ncbi:DUF58 domain-containing protein, partial [Kineococcus rubinsiae]|uniref:DUF58 domain-containing protein n=1 Tax=Kineococcus rubinsiae TaxID=2609562 RepID=UPI001431C2D8
MSPAPAQVSARVRALLSIPAHRRTWGLLEGSYAAVVPGRSHDLDDLRAYVPGDDVRDIDWKASARHVTPLVKRYVARREQTVLLLVTTGRDLAATAPDGGTKAHAVLAVAELLAAVAAGHGDPVGLVGADAAGAVRLPARTSAGHRLLLRRTLEARMGPGAPATDLAALLAASTRVRRRWLAVVLADDVDLSPEVERAVRRLAAQHELLWLTVADADPGAGAGDGRDTATARRLPAPVRRAAAVRAE